MGAWQTDPEVQRLAQAVMAANAAPFTGQKRTQLDQATAALQHYIDANRARLGVPDGYSVRGDGQLHKTGYPWWVIPATGAGMALGGLGLGAALGGSAAGAATGAIAAPVGTVAPGVVNLATPASNAAAAAVPPAASGGLSGVIKSLTSAGNLPSLVGLGTSLLGGLGNGGGSNNAELDRIQQITEARMRRADPLHQAITSLAMSRLPTAFQRPVPDVPLPEK